MSWKVDKQKLFQVEYDLCVFQFIGEERELAKAFGAGNMHATLELDKELPQIRNIVDQGDMLDKNNITVRVVVPTQVVQKKTLRFISLPGSQHTVQTFPSISVHVESAGRQQEKGSPKEKRAEQSGKSRQEKEHDSRI